MSKIKNADSQEDLKERLSVFVGKKNNWWRRMRTQRSIKKWAKDWNLKLKKDSDLDFK